MPDDCCRAPTAPTASGLRPPWRSITARLSPRPWLPGSRPAVDDKGWSIAHLARISGVGRYTIAKALAGEAWPDLLTIANLEKALECDLWPGRDV